MNFYYLGDIWHMWQPGFQHLINPKCFVWNPFFGMHAFWVFGACRKWDRWHCERIISKRFHRNILNQYLKKVSLWGQRLLYKLLLYKAKLIFEVRKLLFGKYYICPDTYKLHHSQHVIPKTILSPGCEVFKNFSLITFFYMISSIRICVV